MISVNVDWVSQILDEFKVKECEGDPYKLIQMLELEFYEHRIGFDIEPRPIYGRGIFKDESSFKAGICGAEWHGYDAEVIMIIYLSKKVSKFNKVDSNFINRLQEVIAHELVHAEQTKMSKTSSIGYCDDDDFMYFSDSHEIQAVAVEAEMQLLRINSDVDELIKMIQTTPHELYTSDRFRLYKEFMKEEPAFTPFHNRFMTVLIKRLQRRKHGISSISRMC